MAATPRISHELRNMLVEGVEHIELVSRSDEGQRTVYELRAHRGGIIFDYVIEEPTMRLHRKSVTGSGTSIDIVLEYTDAWSNPKDWVPSRIVATREPGGYRAEFRNMVRETATVGPDRFTLKELKVPVGTAVVDNLQNRRLGYWDGKQTVEKSATAEGWQKVFVPFYVPWKVPAQ